MIGQHREKRWNKKKQHLAQEKKRVYVKPDYGERSKEASNRRVCNDPIKEQYMM